MLHYLVVHELQNVILLMLFNPLQQQIHDSDNITTAIKIYKGQFNLYGSGIEKKENYIQTGKLQ